MKLDLVTDVYLVEVFTEVPGYFLDTFHVLNKHKMNSPVCEWALKENQTGWIVCRIYSVYVHED